MQHLVGQLAVLVGQGNPLAPPPLPFHGHSPRSDGQCDAAPARVVVLCRTSPRRGRRGRGGSPRVRRPGRHVRALPTVLDFSVEAPGFSPVKRSRALMGFSPGPFLFSEGHGLVGPGFSPGRERLPAPCRTSRQRERLQPLRSSLLPRERNTSGAQAQSQCARNGAAEATPLRKKKSCKLYGLGFGPC